MEEKKRKNAQRRRRSCYKNPGLVEEEASEEKAKRS
jgi:hypothetical protein